MALVLRVKDTQTVKLHAQTLEWEPNDEVWLPLIGVRLIPNLIESVTDVKAEHADNL